MIYPYVFMNLSPRHKYWYIMIIKLTSLVGGLQLGCSYGLPGVFACLKVPLTISYPSLSLTLFSGMHRVCY